jgi:hypothetical protein
MDSPNLKTHLNSISIKQIKTLIRQHNLHYKIKLSQNKPDLINDILKHYESDIIDNKMISKKNDMEIPKIEELKPKIKIKKVVKKVVKEVVKELAKEVAKEVLKPIEVEKELPKAKEDIKLRLKALRELIKIERIKIQPFREKQRDLGKYLTQRYIDQSDLNKEYHEDMADNYKNNRLPRNKEYIKLTKSFKPLADNFQKLINLEQELQSDLVLNK